MIGSDWYHYGNVDCEATALKTAGCKKIKDLIAKREKKPWLYVGTGNWVEVTMCSSFGCKEMSDWPELDQSQLPKNCLDEGKGIWGKWAQGKQKQCRSWPWRIDMLWNHFEAAMWMSRWSQTEQYGRVPSSPGMQLEVDEIITSKRVPTHFLLNTS